MKAELFELLFRVLHHNWRYFFKSSVLASVQRGVAEEQMENEAQFSAIMQVTAIPVFVQNSFCRRVYTACGSALNMWVMGS